MDPTTVVGGSILTSLAALDWHLLVVYAGVWFGAPLLTYINLEFLQYDRAKRGLAAIPRLELRLLAGFLSGLTALFVGSELGRWDIRTAIDHAIAVGCAYPLLVWAIKEYLKKQAPDAAKDLELDDKTRLPGE